MESAEVAGGGSDGLQILMVALGPPNKLIQLWSACHAECEIYLSMFSHMFQQDALALWHVLSYGTQINLYSAHIVKQRAVWHCHK